MAKYCSWCGEPLEPGARYCAECGARVLESVRVTGKGDSDPMRGLDIVGGNPIPASKTTKLDLGTLEALKLRDSLPGDDEPTQVKPSAVSAAEPMAKPLPIAAVVLPTASSLSVISRT